MSRQVGRLLVSLGVDSSTVEAARAAVGTSLFFFVVGLFAFGMYLCIVTQCLSCCLVLYLFTVPVRH